jgi:hypothetical protein
MVEVARMETGTERSASPKEGANKCEWGELAVFTHTHLHEQVKLADQKAATVFFATAGLLGYIANSWGLPLHGLVAFRGLAAWFAVVAGVALSAAALAALAVVVPRFSSRSSVVPVFFKHICSLRSAAEYIQAIESLTADEASRAILQENFAVAHICNTKYRMLRLAIWTGSAGYLAAFIYFLLRR